MELELLLPPAVFCPNGNPVATSVITEVHDALNQPVAHVHSDPVSSNTGGYSTQVTFTPTAAGVHYLTARFEPALGITQRQLQVALERSSEVPWLRTRLGAICDEVLPLREAVMCRRGTQLSVIRDGGVSSTESITAAASAGEVGWLWTDARLSRLEDVDGGIQSTNAVMAEHLGLSGDAVRGLPIASLLVASGESPITNCTRSKSPLPARPYASSSEDFPRLLYSLSS